MVLTEAPVLTADFEVSNHGSIVLITPLTEAAHRWVSENVSYQPWQLFGGGIAIEPRYADTLVEDILGEGLTVQ